MEPARQEPRHTPEFSYLGNKVYTGMIWSSLLLALGLSGVQQQYTSSSSSSSSPYSKAVWTPATLQYTAPPPPPPILKQSGHQLHYSTLLFLPPALF